MLSTMLSPSAAPACMSPALSLSLSSSSLRSFPGAAPPVLLLPRLATLTRRRRRQPPACCCLPSGQQQRQAGRLLGLAAASPALVRKHQAAEVTEEAAGAANSVFLAAALQLLCTADAKAVEYGEDLWTVPEVSPAQTVAGSLLVLAIGFLLFRSLRRRAQRATSVKYTSGADKTAEEIALEVQKAKELDIKAPPTVLGTLSGALVAGAIALVCWRFTQTVEATFAGQNVSSEYTVRNITITIRTIIVGTLYLGTFVFGFNAFGLFLYGMQLLINGPPPSSPGTPDSNKLPATSDTRTSLTPDKTTEKKSD
eukprot:jgi/Chlat1/8206/Chrsp76S07634